MILTPNGLVRSAEEDRELDNLPPGIKRILTEEMPKFLAWLNQPHPKIEKAYREGNMGKYKDFDFFKDQ